MGKTIMVNIEKCLACKSCEIACALAHCQSRILEEAITEQPRPQRRVTVEAAGEFGVPMQCRHCEDAPCITVCPTNAIHREQSESPVLINPDLCIGCKFCIMICPFGVIDISWDGKVVTKCDLCIGRTEFKQEPANHIRGQGCPKCAGVNRNTKEDFIIKANKVPKADSIVDTQ